MPRRVAVLVVLSFALVATSAEPTRMIGHRGLPLEAPENTLAGFAACLELRVGFELDVRRTKDGKLVCLHDDGVARTTDGKGNLAELTFDELRRLDAGEKFNPAFRGERVPTLEEVFVLLKQRARPGTLVALDLKVEDDKLPTEVIELARTHGVIDYLICIGTTIDRPNVRRALRKAHQTIGIACLAQKRENLDAALKDENANWAYVRFIPTAEEVATAHRAGKKVFVVGPTVMGREPDNWKKAHEAGVDAVLTDHPLDCRRAGRP